MGAPSTAYTEPVQTTVENQSAPQVTETEVTEITKESAEN